MQIIFFKKMVLSLMWEALDLDPIQNYWDEWEC